MLFRYSDINRWGRNHKFLPNSVTSLFLFSSS
uniref:Uncharacterized protein n=1 Tax=Arundo donax TaxID=35708 RepID=A0A0A9ATD5_ARUDO